MSEYSRRTVVRGAAWSVPVIAVAAQAPAFASSRGTVVIDFGRACGNTGADRKGCGTDKSLQVPLEVSNPTDRDIIVQITDMFTCNCATAPTAGGTGVASGVEGIFRTPDFSVPNQNNCTRASLASTVACTSTGVTGGSILIPALTTTPLNFFIVSARTRASDDFSTTIKFQILDAATCNVIQAVSTRSTDFAISPQNCNGSFVAPVAP